MRSLVGLVCACLVVGCGASRGGDFTTPSSAARTFFEAAARLDRDQLAACFSSDSEGEFRTLVDKSASDESLRELQAMFRGAEVVEERIDGNQARVRVSLQRAGREQETLYMVREGERWLIRGF